VIIASFFLSGPKRLPPTSSPPLFFDSLIDGSAQLCLFEKTFLVHTSFIFGKNPLSFFNGHLFLLVEIFFPSFGLEFRSNWEEPFFFSSAFVFFMKVL